MEAQKNQNVQDCNDAVLSVKFHSDTSSPKSKDTILADKLNKQNTKNVKNYKKYQNENLCNQEKNINSNNVIVISGKKNDCSPNKDKFKFPSVSKSKSKIENENNTKDNKVH